MNAIRFALSDHDTESPLTADEANKLASEMEDVLIDGEAQFSHPDWRYVDGLRAYARACAAVSPAKFVQMTAPELRLRDFAEGRGRPISPEDADWLCDEIDRLRSISGDTPK